MNYFRTKELQSAHPCKPLSSGWGSSWRPDLVQARSDREKQQSLAGAGRPFSPVIQGKIPNYEVKNRIFKADEVTTQPNKTEVSDPVDYSGQNKSGYLTNVIAMPGTAMTQGDLDIKDRPASEIATEYAKGFANATDKKNRLKMVINVNKRDDPWEANPRQALTTEVNSERIKVAALPCKVAVIGTLWSNQWYQDDNKQDVAVSDVRHAFTQNHQLDEPTAKAGYSQKFKWSGMREKTYQSSSTTTFKGQMALRGLNVYIHTGDGDIVSVQHTGEDDQSLEGKGIYNRMDDFLAQNGDTDVVSGGVTYRGIHQGGDAPEPNAWVTKVVGDLDFKHRQEMQEELPTSPWFAEPNTFVKADLFANSNALFKKLNNNKNLKPAERDWAYATWVTQQSPDIGSFMQLLPPDPTKTAVSYDKLSIMSGATNHDQHGVQGAEDNAITRNDFLKRLVDLKSTSIEFAAWTNGIQQAYRSMHMLTIGGTAEKKKLSSEATWLKAARIIYEAELGQQNNADLTYIHHHEMGVLAGRFAAKYQNSTFNELIPDSIRVTVKAKMEAMATKRADMLKGAIAKFDATTPKARERYGKGQVSFDQSLESAEIKRQLEISLRSWHNKVQFFDRLINRFAGYQDPLSTLIRGILRVLRTGCVLMRTWALIRAAST